MKSVNKGMDCYQTVRRLSHVIAMRLSGDLYLSQNTIMFHSRALFLRVLSVIFYYIYYFIRKYFNIIVVAITDENERKVCGGGGIYTYHTNSAYKST